MQLSIPQLHTKAIVTKNHPHLCDHGACSSTLVSPGWWEDTDGLVVAGETVDTGLDENKTELRVLILSVALKMLADSNGLLDQHIQVLWNLWGKTIGFENSQDLVTSNDLDLSDTMRVTEDNTDLRWSGTFLRKLANLVDDLLGSGLQPRRRSARVWESRG